MMFYRTINEFNGFCIIRHFTSGDNGFDRKLGLSVNNEMNFVTKEGISLSLMSPFSISVRILTQTLTLGGTLTDFDTKPFRVSP